MASVVRALLFQPASDSLAAAVLGAPPNASNVSFGNSTFGNSPIGNSSLQAHANASNARNENSFSGNSSYGNFSLEGLLEALANTSNSSAGNSSSLLGNSSFGNSSRGRAAASSTSSSSSNHEEPHAACLLWEGEGCTAIHDRETCLGKRDGRPWAYWDGFAVAGQPCAWCSGEKCVEGSDARCMPHAWVENRTALTVANCSKNETVQIVSKMLSSIWESPLNADSSVQFEPAVADRRCAARGMDDSGQFNKFYWTFTAKSHNQCQGICASKTYCKGFQFESERRACQIWWHPIDSVEAVPLGFGRNFSCVRVATEGAEGGSVGLAAEFTTTNITTTATDTTTIVVPARQEVENFSEELFGNNNTVQANLTDAQQITTANELVNSSEHALQEELRRTVALESASLAKEQNLDGNATADANLTDRQRAAATRQALSTEVLQEGLTDQQKAAIGGAVGGVAGAALLGGLLGGLLPGALATHTATVTATVTFTTTTVWVAEALVRNLSDDDNLSDENASDGSLLPASTRVLTRGSDGLQDFMGGGGQPRWSSWALPGLLLAALLAVALAFACGFAHHATRSAEIDESDSSDLESQAVFFEYNVKVAPPAPSSGPLAGVGQPPPARAPQATRPPAAAVRRSPPAARQTASSNWRPMLARVFRDMPAGGARSLSSMSSAQRLQPVASSPLLARPVSLQRLRAPSPLLSASPLQQQHSTRTLSPLRLSAGASTVVSPTRISARSTTTQTPRRRREASPLRQASLLRRASPPGSPRRLSMGSQAAVSPALRFVPVGARGRPGLDVSPVTTQPATPVDSQVLYDIATQFGTPVSSQTVPVGSQSSQFGWQVGPAMARLAEPMVPAPLSARRNAYAW